MDMYRRLTHDITLDNIDTPLDDTEKNFPVFESSNKENDSSLTTKWTSAGRSAVSTRCPQQPPRTTVDLLGDRLRNISSSTTPVGFNNLLEARNQLNAAKSKLDTREDNCIPGNTLADGRRTGGMDLTFNHAKKVRSEVTSSYNSTSSGTGTTEASCCRECAKSGLNSFSGSGLKNADVSSIVRRTEDRKELSTTSSAYTKLDDARIPVRFIPVRLIRLNSIE
jgi:hypothetical protein